MTSADQHTSARRNPPWTRDELILALNLYFHLGRKAPDQFHPEVIALSKVLNGLPIHELRPDASRFRNPAGVSMKLTNFSSLDPMYAGTGLSHGGRADQLVWDEFSHDPDRLHAVAQAIRTFGELQQESPASVDEEEFEAAEGEVLYRQHRQYERNRSLVAKKKQQALEHDRELRCEVCGFVFARKYGPLGQDFIECHHVVPLADLRPRRNTTLQDLALVCSNCHRMLHQGGHVRSIAALREAIETSQGAQHQG